ncbi:MAG: ATP-binding cassette domain-containing protein, partial [Anaerolineales bacterium]
MIIIGSPISSGKKAGFSRRLVTLNATLQRGIAAAQNIFEFVDAPSEQDTGQQVLERVKGEVVFRDITFGYSREGGAPVLKDINLTIHAGQSVAFVGRSGAGKTTLVSLLPRFY